MSGRITLEDVEKNYEEGSGNATNTSSSQLYHPTEKKQRKRNHLKTYLEGNVSEKTLTVINPKIDV